MYLIDANAFMEASRLYYSFKLAPGYWHWLTARHQSGEIASVESVYDEITAGVGELVSWAKDSAQNGFWLPDTAHSLAEMATLATWANEPERPYKQAAIDEFMDSADLRLVAQASAIGATVVTRETRDANCKRRVKLPDAGAAVRVPCVQPFLAYEQLGLTLT